MMDNSVTSIQITKAIPFRGKNSLESRLRKVGLRSFPDVRIYENAEFSYPSYDPQSAKSVLSISQPHVHQTYLDRIYTLDELFQAEGVDIFNLTQGYDYTALNSRGESTEWTMLPPVVEVFSVPRHATRRLRLRYALGTGFTEVACGK